MHDRALALRALDARLASAPGSSTTKVTDASPSTTAAADASAIDANVGDATGVADLKSEPAAFKEGGAAAKE